MRDNVNAKVFTLASVALLSCRAVLGIEEIEEGAADGGAGTDAGADSAATDSAAIDTGVDAGPNAECWAMTGTECGKCCRNANMLGNSQLEQAFKVCVCADGGCAQDACQSTTICGGGAEPKDTPCIPCVDLAINTNSCPVGRDECAKISTCKMTYDCLVGCK